MAEGKHNIGLIARSDPIRGRFLLLENYRQLLCQYCIKLSTPSYLRETFKKITFRPEKEMSPAWHTARLSTHVALNVLGHIQVREFCATVCELGIYRSDCNLALFLRFRRTLRFGSLLLEKDPVSLFNTEPKSGILDPLYGEY